MAKLGVWLVLLAGTVVACWWLLRTSEPEAPQAGTEPVAAETRPEPAPAAPAARETVALADPTPASAPVAAVPAAAAATAAAAEEKPGDIRGVVVTEEGHPLTGVNIRALSAGSFVGAGSAVSAADGTFVLRRPPNADDSAVELHVFDYPGFEQASTAPVLCGTKGVRLVLRHGPTLEVVTLDAESGAAVDACSCKVGSVRNEGASRGLGPGIAVIARPKPGVALLAPTVKGSGVLVVSPTDGRHARVAARVQFSGASMQQEVVRLPPRQRRTLRVLDAAGLPVAKAVYDLTLGVDPGVPQTWHQIIDPDGSSPGYGGRVRIQAGDTDADGEAPLFAAPGVRYDLCVMPPGRAYTYLSDVLIGDRLEPLVIRLDAAATIAGKIGPKAVVARMWRDEKELAAGRAHRPALWLVPLRQEGAGSQPPSADGQVPLREDGAFEFAGVPSGSFHVAMYWYDEQCTAHHEKLGEVRDLRIGERRQLDVALDHLLRFKVSGRVLLDELPVADERLELMGPFPGIHRPIRTDANGAFTALLERGAWRVEIAVPRGPGLTPTHRLPTEPGEVKAAPEQVVTLRVTRHRLVVTVLDAAGAPAPGLKVFTMPDRHPGPPVAVTDGAGVVEFDWLAAGNVTLLWQRAPHQPFTGKPPSGPSPQVTLGRVEIPSGQALVAATLRLPAPEKQDPSGSTGSR